MAAALVKDRLNPTAPRWPLWTFLFRRSARFCCFFVPVDMKNIAVGVWVVFCFPHISPLLPLLLISQSPLPDPLKILLHSEAGDLWVPDRVICVSCFGMQSLTGRHQQGAQRASYFKLEPSIRTVLHCTPQETIIFHSNPSVTSGRCGNMWSGSFKRPTPWRQAAMKETDCEPTFHLPACWAGTAALSPNRAAMRWRDIIRDRLIEFRKFFPSEHFHASLTNTFRRNLCKMSDSSCK